MTKEGIEEIIKRYPWLARAIKENKSEVQFYVGHRKQVISVSEEVETVFRIIEDIYAYEKNDWIRKIMDGLKKGRTDIAIMRDVPWEKNAYYERKRKIIEKVYNCCISFDMVNYEEILKENIV